MNELITELGLADNQFLSGGLAMGVLFGLWASIRRIPRRVWPFIRRRVIFTATVDTAYNDTELHTIHSWLARNGYGVKIGHLYYSRYGGTFTPGNMFVWIKYKGKRLLLQHVHEDENTDKGSKARKRTNITGLRTSKDTILELVEEIRSTPVERREGMTRVNTQSLYHGRGTWVSARNPDTLWLPDGQYEDLINDVQGFIDSRDEYRRFGIPYHRAWLLQGPPGTGKSSLVQAVASDLDRGITVVDGIDKMTSGRLYNILVDAAEDDNIVLIEDVDATGVGAEQDPEDDDPENKPITLADLLNALDGIGTPPGMMLFMTTNHPERISQRLLRPGRVDKVLDVGYISVETAGRMARHFLPDDSETAEEIMRWAANGNVTPAMVQGELLKRKFSK